MNNHGGKRKGAGRKPSGNAPKKSLGVKVSHETKNTLLALKRETGHSQAAIVEYAIQMLKKLPKALELGLQ